jgi:hypothetical protein
MTPSQIAFIAAISAAVGSIVASVIGGIFSSITTYITRKSDERRHIRETAMRIAMEHWKEVRESAHILGKETGISTQIPAFDSYVIHALKLAELVSTKKLTADNVQSELIEIRKISDAAIKAGLPKN